MKIKNKLNINGIAVVDICKLDTDLEVFKDILNIFNKELYIIQIDSYKNIPPQIYNKFKIIDKSKCIFLVNKSNFNLIEKILDCKPDLYICGLNENRFDDYYIENLKHGNISKLIDGDVADVFISFFTEDKFCRIYINSKLYNFYSVNDKISSM